MNEASMPIVFTLETTVFLLGELIEIGGRIMADGVFL